MKPCFTLDLLYLDRASENYTNHFFHACKKTLSSCTPDLTESNVSDLILKALWNNAKTSPNHPIKPGFCAIRSDKSGFGCNS